MSTGSDARREDSFSQRLSERIDALPPQADALRVIGLLRAEFPPEIARWGATLHEMRARARRLYPTDPPLWMTRRGWEQATAPPVAARRARLIRALEPRHCHDATCGIGVDARALAREHPFTVASDRDPWMASCARAQLREAGLRDDRVLVADAESSALRADFLLLDPDRRATARGERASDPALFSPRLGRALELTNRAEAGCIKLPPGLSPRSLESSTTAELRLEWVSLRGEMRELSVWTGAAAERLGPGRVAVVLDDRRGLEVTLEARSDSVEPEPPALSLDQTRESSLLVEPDPAVLRAGLVGQLARELALSPFSPEIAYLGHPDREADKVAAAARSLAKVYRVLDRSEADPKRVRAMLRRHEIGTLTVKTRGHPDTAATLEKRYRCKGEQPGLLCVTRAGPASGRDGHHLALLLEPVPHPGQNQGAPPA